MDQEKKYNFTQQQKFLLVAKGISNGCGKKGGFNFSIFFDKVQNFFGFKNEKFDSFKYDIKELCSFDHDIRFWEGGNILDFLVSNYIFANEVLKLMRWTNVYGRFISFCVIFFGLSIFGTSAFNWGEKKDINDFLKANK